MARDNERGNAFPHPSADDWRRRVIAELGDEPVESLDRQLPDGFSLQPLYTAEDLEAGVWRQPGRRGDGPPELCTVVQALSPQAIADQVSEDLAGGADGVWLRLDRLARLGTDPAEALPVETLGVLDGAPLIHGSDLATALGDWTSGSVLWIDTGANALPWAALWLAECERAGRDPADGRIHFGADPLAALARDGVLPRDRMKLSSEMAALTRFAERHLAGSTALTISTAVYQEAGADQAQELGFMVATLLEYIRDLADSGLPAESAADAISLRFALGIRIFPEIAKLRAARVLWRAALGAVGMIGPPPALVHAVGSRRSLSRREPALNLLRASEQAFIAFNGGADAVSCLAFDAVMAGAAESGPLARRLARNTALILEHEGKLGRVEDPAAGSYYVEAMTRRLATQGWALAQRIEQGGGMRRALLEGRVAEMVAEKALQRERAFAAGEAALTGVTRYVDEEGVAGEPSDSVTRGQDRAREGVVTRLETHRATWNDAVAERNDYSRDFVVEELVSQALRGETIRDLGRRLGGAEGSESIEPLGLRRDAAPYETDVPSVLAQAEGISRQEEE